MSVLLKDMAMPRRCGECQLVDAIEGYCHGARKQFDDEYFNWRVTEEGYTDYTKPINCPLTEVKIVPEIEMDKTFKFVN